MDGVEKVLDLVKRAHEDTNVAMTSDGRWFVSVGVNGNQIRFFNKQRKEQQLIEAASIVYSFTLSEDSKYLLIDTGNCAEEGQTEKLEIWSRQDDERIAVLVGHKRNESTILTPCFGGKKDKFVASGSIDNEVKIWHLPEAGEEIQDTKPCQTLAGHSETVNCVSWKTGDPCMLASASGDTTIRIPGTEELW